MTRQTARYWESLALSPGPPLPETYGKDVLILLPRDPHWMFTYWEITESLWQTCVQRWGARVVEQAQVLLRVHDVTGIDFPNSPSHRWFDIPITPAANNWYIQVDQSGRSYCIELGLKTTDGRFLLLLRSNVIHLPLGRVSDIVDEQWMSIDQETFEKLLERLDIQRTRAGSAEIVHRLARRWERMQIGFSWKGGVRAQEPNADGR